MPYTAYFRQVEAIYQGCPHWGKMHTLDYQTLSQLYPHWDDFLRIRQQLDPQGMFLNAYLCTLLGLAAGEPMARTERPGEGRVQQQRCLPCPPEGSAGLP